MHPRLKEYLMKDAVFGHVTSVRNNRLEQSLSRLSLAKCSILYIVILYAHPIRVRTDSNGRHIFRAYARSWSLVICSLFRAAWKGRFSGWFRRDKSLRGGSSCEEITSTGKARYQLGKRRDSSRNSFLGPRHVNKGLSSSGFEARA